MWPGCGQDRPLVPVVQHCDRLAVYLHCHLNVAAADSRGLREVAEMSEPLAFV